MYDIIIMKSMETLTPTVSGLQGMEAMKMWIPIIIQLPRCDRKLAMWSKTMMWTQWFHLVSPTNLYKSMWYLHCT